MEHKKKPFIVEVNGKLGFYATPEERDAAIKKANDAGHDCISMLEISKDSVALIHKADGTSYLGFRE